MNHRTSSALKVALLCLLVTSLIAACGSSSIGTKTNGSPGSTVRPGTDQPNPSSTASSTTSSSNAAPGSVNPAPAQPTAPASNPSGGSAVQSSAGSKTAVSNDEAKGNTADQSLTDLENSLNSMDTIDDLK